MSQTFLISTLLTVSAMPFLSCATRLIEQENSAETKAIKTNNGTRMWVDTHDHYAHSYNHNPKDRFNVLNVSEFPYFHKRADGKPGAMATFDCGFFDGAPRALEILDVLKANNVKITFFVSGGFLYADSNYTTLSKDPVRLNVIKRMVEDGHEFGNHTLHHYSLIETEANNSHIWIKNVAQELQTVEHAWKKMVEMAFAGQNIPANAKMLPYWRAPYGQYSDGSRKEKFQGKPILLPDILTPAAQAGFPHHFGWNVDTRDSVAGPSVTAKSMTDSILTYLDIQKNAKGQFPPAFVFLAHLSNVKNWGATPDGLEKLIKEVRNRGYEWSRVSELYAFNDTIPQYEKRVVPEIKIPSRFPQFCNVIAPNNQIAFVYSKPETSATMQGKDGKDLKLEDQATIYIEKNFGKYYSFAGKVDGVQYGELYKKLVYIDADKVLCHM